MHGREAKRPDRGGPGLVDLRIGEARNLLEDQDQGGLPFAGRDQSLEPGLHVGRIPVPATSRLAENQPREVRGPGRSLQREVGSERMAEERPVRAKRGHDGNDVLDLRGVLGGVFARASAATIHGVDGEAARQNGG
jgi:hypothetical protein